MNDIRVCLLFITIILFTCQTIYACENIATTDTITVMTYNIRHGNPPAMTKSGTIDLKKVANVINKYHPDLVALQEVDVNNNRSGMKLNEAKKLGKLTGMYSHFSRIRYYKGGQYGIAVLSRFPIGDRISHQFPVHTANRKKALTICLIKVKVADEQSIYFGNVHLDYHGNPGIRLQQAHKLLSFVSTLSAPLIVGGDFNTTPGTKAINLLTKNLKRSCESGCGPTYPTNQPYKKIDYIMFKPSTKFKVIHHQVLAKERASDHVPYLVTLITRLPVNTNSKTSSKTL